MSERCQNFLIGAFGASMVFAAIISSYYGDEQFKWPQSTHRLVMLSLLAVGLVCGFAWDWYCRKDKSPCSLMDRQQSSKLHYAGSIPARDTTEGNEMYFVNSANHLCDKVKTMLVTFFGDKAKVKIGGDRRIYVKVDKDAGFKEVVHSLTAEQIAQGVCGGGVIQELDGHVFTIEVKEVPDWAWGKDE